MNRHPEAVALALHAGGDLPWWRRISVVAHLRECERCQFEVERYRQAGAAAAGLAGLPDLNWNALAAEMQANIRLGLTAGEIVRARESRPAPFGWRRAAAFGCVSALLMAGVWLQRPQPRAVAAPDIVLEASGEGIVLRQGKGELALMHGGGRDVTYSAGAQGAIRARYVDEDSGQVTINHVYAH